MNRKLIIAIIVVVILVGVVAFFASKSTKTVNNDQSITNENIESSNQNDIIENNENVERYENMKLYIKVNNETLTATLSDNSSVDALVERLKNEPLTINMSDYANMEKVGSLGFSLPRNDEQISTGAGDLILYQGNSFVIYYDHNNWNFTRLGKIDNISQKELKDILGTGDVTVTLSIEE